MLPVGCLPARKLPPRLLQAACKLPAGCQQVACSLPVGCLQAARGLPAGCPQAGRRLPASCLQAICSLPVGSRLLAGYVQAARRLPAGCLQAACRLPGREGEETETRGGEGGRQKGWKRSLWRVDHHPPPHPPGRWAAILREGGPPSFRNYGGLAGWVLGHYDDDDDRTRVELSTSVLPFGNYGGLAGSLAAGTLR